MTALWTIRRNHCFPVWSAIALSTYLTIHALRVHAWVPQDLYRSNHAGPHAQSSRRSVGPPLFSRQTVILQGVLSRSVILKHSGGGTKNVRSQIKKRSSLPSSVPTAVNKITRPFLIQATEEAMHRQQIAMDHLELERQKLLEKLSFEEDENEERSKEMAGKVYETKRRVDPKVGLQRVDCREQELRSKLRQLKDLQQELKDKKKYAASKSAFLHNDLLVAESTFRRIMSGSTNSTLPCSILDRPRQTWKIFAEKKKDREYGRPRGFDGLVFSSPLGVPILVGNPQTDGDNSLRRIAQGADLWFQVEDYEGSRVLLRTSLKRGTKNSKKCLQMAADLAAYYSIHSDVSTSKGGSVPVMYTDSKHVAKRGRKAGRMRKRKSLGRILGHPSSVIGLIEG